MNGLSDTRLAALLALTAFFVFSITDAVSRHLIQSGHSIFFVAGMFQGLALATLFLAERKLGGIKSLLTSGNKKTHLLRGILFCITIPMNVYAFSVLPFALVYSLFFTGSFWAILLSRAITGEHIRIEQMFAVALGMIGAMIVLRPWQSDFDMRLLIPLCSAMLYGVRSLLDRKIGAQETPLSMAVFPMLLGVPVMLVVGLAKSTFMIPTLPDMGLLLISGVLLGIGMLSLPLAFKHAPITIVGPFHYTQLIWGGLFGFLFFNQTPDLWTIIGGIIIVIGGLTVLFQKRA